jgi:hypothetical protein
MLDERVSDLAQSGVQFPRGLGRGVLSQPSRSRLWAPASVRCRDRDHLYFAGSDGRPLAFSLADGIALPTYGQRPNIVGTPKRNHGSDWVFNYFADPSVFQRTPDFTIGNAPRADGAIRSPWSFTTDLSIGKQFPVREEMNIEVRMEARNAFNHPVFGTPNTSVDDPSFGQISYTSVGPREIQMAIKFNF